MADLTTTTVSVRKRKAPRGRRRAIVNARPRTGGKRVRRRRRAGRASVLRGLTPAGSQFVKSVMAPYDGAQDGCLGVPDAYRGPALSTVMRETFTILTSTTNDTFIAILPTPQIAYWSRVTTPGLLPTSTFTGVPFTQQQVASSGGSSVAIGGAMEAFRMSGLTVEAKNISPVLTQEGVIYARRAPFKLATTNIQRTVTLATGVGTVVVPESYLLPEGLSSNFNGITASPHYTGEGHRGVYSVGVHSGPWAFSDKMNIIPPDNASAAIDVPALSTANSPIVTDDGRLSIPTASAVLISNSFDWVDENMSAIFLRLPPTSTVQTYAMEVMMFCEFKPTSNTVFSNIVGASPVHDPMAIALYESMALSLPQGVPACENANFWRNLLSIVKTGGFVASRVLPGPLGLVGTGVETISTGLEQLFFPEEEAR